MCFLILTQKPCLEQKKTFKLIVDDSLLAGNQSKTQGMNQSATSPTNIFAPIF